MKYIINYINLNLLYGPCNFIMKNRSVIARSICYSTVIKSEIYYFIAFSTALRTVRGIRGNKILDISVRKTAKEFKVDLFYLLVM